jgi:acyl-CoA reductase-like NAD-dependent aldehyde dehydrogenase
MNFLTTDASAQSQQTSAAAHAERDIINPATGEVIVTVPEQGGDEVDAAESVTSAFSWRPTRRSAEWKHAA